VSIETTLVELLRSKCSRVYADGADVLPQKPYVIWQGLGGQSQRYLDGTSSLRHRLVQVSVWADSRLAADALIADIEAALCASKQFTARPQGEPLNTKEADLGLYGAQQDFSIWAPR